MNLSKGQKLALAISGVVIVAGAATYWIVKHYRNTHSDNGEFIPEGDGGTIGGGNTSGGSANVEKPTEPQLLATVVKKGSKGEVAKDVQRVINQIASWRGWNGTTKKVGLKSVKFPIGVDGDFGSGSDTAAKLIFDSYKQNEQITLNKANEKLAYAAGWYNKAFPALLAKYKDSSVLKRYNDEFKRGNNENIANKGKQAFGNNEI